MKHFFWLGKHIIRLSSIVALSTVESSHDKIGGYFTIYQRFPDYNEAGYSVYYPTIQEAVAVHSALVEAMEGDAYNA